MQSEQNCFIGVDVRAKGLIKGKFIGPGKGI